MEGERGRGKESARESSTAPGPSDLASKVGPDGEGRAARMCRQVCEIIVQVSVTRQLLLFR